MKHNFETSLPIGLVMSMYDLNIPAENKTIISGASLLDSFTTTCQTQHGEDEETHEHIWINGELSWRL